MSVHDRPALMSIWRRRGGCTGLRRRIRGDLIIDEAVKTDIRPVTVTVLHYNIKIHLQEDIQCS